MKAKSFHDILKGCASQEILGIATRMQTIMAILFH